MVSRPERRFPRRVYGRGSEPDPRFSLANERTFLAWLRTSLALLAAGAALEALHIPENPVYRGIAASVFVALGVGSAANAWFGWMRAEHSLRNGRSLPGMPFGAVLAVGVAVGGLLVGIGLLL